MTVSERVALAQQIEELEKPKATERQGARTDLPTLGSGEPNVPRAMPGERGPRSADVAAAGAVAAYLDPARSFKAPEVITPGPRVRRYMNPGFRETGPPVTVGAAAVTPGARQRHLGGGAPLSCAVTMRNESTGRRLRAIRPRAKGERTPASDVRCPVRIGHRAAIVIAGRVSNGPPGQCGRRRQLWGQDSGSAGRPAGGRKQ